MVVEIFTWNSVLMTDFDMIENKKPFFSVVIPTYNSADKLRKTIESVLEQDFDNFELLVMDDGSVDHTQEVVKSFNDKRIHYEWEENSGGPATPRNRGIKKSQSEWICFLDADDIWSSNKLSMVRLSIDHYPDVDVFCHNEILSMLGDDKSSVLHYGPYTENFYQTLLIEGNKLSTSATCVRHSFLIQHKLMFNQSPDYVIVEDYDLWLRLAQKKAKFHFINIPLGKYIVEDGSISLNTPKLKENISTLLRDHVFYLQEFYNDKSRLWNIVTFRLLVQDAKREITKGNYARALMQLLFHGCTSPYGVMYYTKALFERKIVKLIKK